jgi:hypothetical protein
MLGLLCLGLPRWERSAGVGSGRDAPLVESGVAVGDFVRDRPPGQVIVRVVK